MLKLLKKYRCWLPAILAMTMLCCGYAEEQQAPELMEPVGVKMDTAEAYIGEISNISVYDAAIVPTLEELYFPLDGVIAEIHAVVGQQVSAGDVLITLDQEAQAEQIEKLESQIEQIETNGAFDDEIGQIDLSILQVELQALLNQSPLNEDSIALKRLDIEQLQLNLAYNADLRSMQLGRLREELAELQQNMQDNVLRAPVDGTIIYCADVMNGDSVRAYAPVMYLADETQLMVETNYISEGLLKTCHDLYVLAGDSRYEITPVPVDSSEYTSSILAGETVLMQFIIDNPDEKLSAGMYAAICMERNYAENVLLIPSNALYMDGTGRYVYVIEDGERVRRNVTPGLTTDWLTQIKEGLEEREIVHVKD